MFTCKAKKPEGCIIIVGITDPNFTKSLTKSNSPEFFIDSRENLVKLKTVDRSEEIHLTQKIEREDAYAYKKGYETIVKQLFEKYDIAVELPDLIDIIDERYHNVNNDYYAMVNIPHNMELYLRDLDRILGDIKYDNIHHVLPHSALNGERSIKSTFSK